MISWIVCRLHATQDDVLRWAKHIPIGKTPIRVSGEQHTLHSPMSRVLSGSIVDIVSVVKQKSVAKIPLT